MGLPIITTTKNMIGQKASSVVFSTSLLIPRAESARAFVIFGPLKILSQIGQRIGCQWKRLVNAGGDGYRNMNPSK